MAARRLLLLFSLLFLLGAGCSRPVERIAEKRVNQLLPRYLGPADRYQTRVRGSIGALGRGRLRQVDIEGTNVRASDTLTLDRLQIRLEDVAVDRDAGTLESIGTANFTARIGSDHLNRYVRAARPSIADLQIVLLESGVARISGRPIVFGFPTVPVRVDGTLLPRDRGQALDFQPGGAKVSIVPIPAAVTHFISEVLNPVIRLDVFPVPLRVEQARIENQMLILQGTVDGLALIQASRQSR